MIGDETFNSKSYTTIAAANGTEIGPSLVMPVKKGDKVALSTSYFYEEDAPGTTYQNMDFLLNEILISLAASGSSVLNLGESQLINMASGGDQTLNNSIMSLLSTEFDTTDVDKPHAYLVWMLYDQNMNLDVAHSGAAQVENPNALETIIRNDLDVGADGYLYVLWLLGAGTSPYSHEPRLHVGAYACPERAPMFCASAVEWVSNGSDAAVNFDNFLVQYQRGQLRQINDYGSPFAFAPAIAYGLTIAGLNSNSDEYLNKYTSKELQTGEFDSSLSTGLEMPAPSGHAVFIDVDDVPYNRVTFTGFDFGSRFAACPEQMVRRICACRRDPQLGVWFTPDPAEQFHNPYLGIGNNPVMYVDPDGEFAWMIPVIAGAVFGSVNLGIQASNGDINNFGDGLKAFGSGFVAGATIATGVTLGLGVPVLGTAIKVAGLAYAAPTAIGTVANTVHGIASGDWSRLGNTWEQFGGNFYLDENRNFFGQTWQGISRFSWELPQSAIGHGFSQMRNTFGGVDRVDYFGGVTFSTGENNEDRWGISIGNHINISIRDEIQGDFKDHLLQDPLFMHEYGHTLQSQTWGPLYFVPGFLSLNSAGSTGHNEKWYEREANSYSGWYFNRLGINWDFYKGRYPRLMDE
ncbi:MAG: hypothetical protein ABR574_07890 [Cryomorphaceae bacterium]|nr:hypothetical protein [Flavobacteriales bacterium]